MTWHNLLNQLPLGDESMFSGVCIDSRQVRPGFLFVALAGDHVDGHDFIADAVARGAAGILCSRHLPDLPVPQWVVDDPVLAVADLARAHRAMMSCKTIALTGSNGKTSVKEMIAAICPQPSFATPGNLNNHLGVPLSILQWRAAHQYAVFELGANHEKEIAYTVDLVKPHVALINNIAPAHLEGFGDLEGVIRAKGEIYQGLSATGIAVINDDDACAHAWDAHLSDRCVIRFSALHEATIYARDVSLNAQGCAQFELITPVGRARIELRVPGRHHVHNALAAAACCYAVEIPFSHIVTGLHSFSGVPGRMMVRRGHQDALILDDTYNANLRSVLSALDVLSQRAGRRIFVFGDMGELGAWSQEHHQAVGIAAREQGIDVVMTCGQQSFATVEAFGTPAQHYENQQELLEALLPQLNDHTTVLVKGSRSARMENIVRGIVI